MNYKLRDALGASRRLQALVAAGYTQREISAQLGIKQSHVSELITGQQRRITNHTAARVARVFNDLQLIPGTNQTALRRARKHGWAPPLAWDEDAIDNPAATPDIGRHEVVTFEERYTELRELGYNDLQIVTKLGVKPESLLRQLNRYGITPSPELVTVAKARKDQKSVAS
jgi:transcriptional regulator with XRE-family HTH domain